MQFFNQSHLVRLEDNNDRREIAASKIFNKQITDLATDTVGGWIATAFFDGGVHISESKSLNTLWHNTSFLNPKEQSFHGAIQAMEFIEGKYLAYISKLENSDKSEAQYLLVVREPTTGEKIFEFKFVFENNFIQPKMTVSGDGNYLAIALDERLQIFETSQFEMVFEGELPFNLSMIDRDNGSVSAISFLDDINFLALARGTGLYTFNLNDHTFSANFNQELSQSYEGSIHITGDHTFNIFNRSKTTFDEFDLSNLSHRTYNVSHFTNLVTTANEIGVLQEKVMWPESLSLKDMLVYQPHDHQFSVRTVVQSNAEQQYFLTFSANNWKLEQVLGPLNMLREDLEKFYRLFHLDDENSWAIFRDQNLGMKRNGELLYPFAVFNLHTGRMLWSDEMVGEKLYFSENGLKWGYYSKDGSFKVYSRDKPSEPIMSHHVEPDGDPNERPHMSFFLNDTTLYYTKAVWRDSTYATALQSVDLETGDEQQVLDLFSLIPHTFTVFDNRAILSLDFNPFSEIWQNPDALKNKLQIHGYDYAVNYQLLSVNLRTKKIEHQIENMKNYFKEVHVNKHVLITRPYNQAIQLYPDFEPEKPIVLYKRDKDHIFTDSKYYQSSKRLLSKIGLRINNRMYQVGNFDFIFNRPDKLIESLDVYKPKELEAYRMAVQKRRRNSEIDSSFIEMMQNTSQLPEVQIANRKKLSQKTKINKINLVIEAKDNNHGLKMVDIKINGVPVLSEDEFNSATSAGDDVVINYDIKLNTGENVIKVTAKNKAGLTSFPAIVRIIYDPPEPVKPDLYIVTLGVSDYADDLYNLNFADKDARDLQDAFATHDTVYSALSDTAFYVTKKYWTREPFYNTVRRLSFKNKEVTKDKLDDIINFVQNAKEDDVLLVFLAGHGLVDEKGDYYFATHDIDFSNPAARGISYQHIQQLFKATDSRKRLLFMDTCHSGELDPDLEKSKQVVTHFSDSTRLTTNLSRSVSVLSISESQQRNFDSFELMRDLFADFNTTGTVVISAASGTGYAYETASTQNGVFTHAIIQGLQKANKDYQNGISVSELRDFVFNKVELLSQGRQQPTVRQENLEFDFRIW